MFKTISGNICQTVKWQRKSTKDFEAFEFTVTGKELIGLLSFGSWMLSGLLFIILPAVMLIVEPELINSHSKLETNAMYAIMVAGVSDHRSDGMVRLTSLGQDLCPEAQDREGLLVVQEKAP